MKATIRPLKGKYYGTKIDIDYNGLEYSISLWNSGSFEPSDRELADAGLTLEQWRTNEIVQVNDKYYYPNGCPARDVLEICDSHFESRETYKLALIIADKLNGHL